MRILMAFALALVMAQAFGAGQYPEPSDSVAICEQDIPDDMEDLQSSIPLMAAEEIAVAVDTIIANYDADWKDLSMQGKLSFTGLPMKVSVKVYMKRGESVILSARAPIFGEVARVEICQDSIVFINKHSRTYNIQPLTGLAADPKAYMCDIQDLLLGQIAFPGHGRMTPALASDSQWIGVPGNDALIYPSERLQIQGLDYGFVMDSSCWQLRSFVMMIKNIGLVVETDYLYGNEGWTLGLKIDQKGKKMEGEATLSYPDYEAAPLEFTQLGSRYRKVGMKELMKF